MPYNQDSHMNGMIGFAENDERNSCQYPPGMKVVDYPHVVSLVPKSRLPCGPVRRMVPAKSMSAGEPQAIEVEVVEIDGLAPAPRAEPVPEPQTRPEWQDWQKWQRRMLKLDSRWWPVWVILGTIAVFLLLTVGVVVGIVFVIYRIIAGFLRVLLR